MAAKTIEKKINRYIEAVRRHFEVRTAILFGSYAHGRQKRHSDIDLALVVKRDRTLDYLQQRKLLYQLAMDIDTRIEPLLFYDRDVAKREPASFISEIINTGRIMFGALHV